MNFQAIKKAFWIFRIFSFFWTVENRAEKFNCVNYQLDNLLIKGVVGSTIKTWQPKNVGDDG